MPHRDEIDYANAISEQFGQENAHQFDRHGRAIISRPCCTVCGQPLPPGDPLAFARLETRRTPYGTAYAVMFQDAEVTVAGRWEDAIEIARGLDRALTAALAESPS